MEFYPQDVIDGLKVAMAQTGASRGVIGVKAKYKNAIANLTELIKTESSIEIKSSESEDENAEPKSFKPVDRLKKKTKKEMCSDKCRTEWNSIPENKENRLQKAEEAVIKKYGVKTTLLLDDTKEKIKPNEIKSDKAK